MGFSSLKIHVWSQPETGVRIRREDARRVVQRPAATAR